MWKFMRRVFLVLGFLSFLGIVAVAIAVAVLWWQDRQWQKEMQKEEIASPKS